MSNLICFDTEFLTFGYYWVNVMKNMSRSYSTPPKKIYLFIGENQAYFKDQ